MLTLRRLAELATMVLVAVPLFGCGNAGSGDAAAGDARSSRQSGPASGAMSRTPADAFSGAEDIAPADTSRISRIEGRHFDLYRHYHVLASRQMQPARGGVDDEDDDEIDQADEADEADEAKIRHAVIRFSGSGSNRALNACSMRALMALD